MPGKRSSRKDFVIQLVPLASELKYSYLHIFPYHLEMDFLESELFSGPFSPPETVLTAY